MWSGGFWINTNQTAAIMPPRNRMISIGAGQALYWDIAASGDAPPHELTTSGCDSLLAVDAPGFEWSPVDGKLIGWAGGGRVVTMDTNYACTVEEPSDSNTVIPEAPAPYGTFGRWRYVPKYNVFVVVSSVTGKVYLYRHSAGTGSGGGGSPPVVEITFPADGAIIHESSVSVAWNVDGVVQTTQSTESLSVGTNRIIRSATNGAGTTYDTVTVTRSTDPPVVTIVYPVQGMEAFSGPVPVTWRIDGVTQTTQTYENLAEGINTITRQCVYDGGAQSVSASVQIYLDTQPATCLGP
jgi:hypothetical protein